MRWWSSIQIRSASDGLWHVKAEGRVGGGTLYIESRHDIFVNLFFFFFDLYVLPVTSCSA